MTNEKRQEFVTKLETACDLVYQHRDRIESLEDMSMSDLEIISDNVERCLEIVKKAKLAKAIK